MKRAILLLLFLITIFFDVNGQPGHVSVEGVKLDRHKVDYINDCYRIVWGFDDYDIYSLCDNANNSSFGNLKITKVPCDSECEYKYNLYLNGEKTEMSKKDFEFGKGYEFNLKEYIKYYYHKYLDREKLYITIEIIKKCPGDDEISNTITKTIQFVGKGMKYSVFEYRGWEPNENYDPCSISRESGLIDETLTCCNEKTHVEIVTKEEIIHNSSHLGGTTIGANFSFKVGGASIGFNFSQSWNFPFTVTKNTSAVTIQRYVDLGNNQDGKCEYAAVFIKFKHYHEYVYREDCDPNTIEMPIEEHDYYVPMTYGLIKCEDDFYDCPPIGNGKIEEYEDERHNLFARNECSNQLIMNLDNDEYIYSYRWILPNGTEISGEKIIEANSPGLYKCIVKDKCCNEKEFQYNNCSNYETPLLWTYDESSNQYCTEINCHCGDIGVIRSTDDETTYTMCVTPQRYDSDWTFDESRKKCTKHAYWTDQNGVEIDLTEAVGEEDIDAEDENVHKEPIVEENNTLKCIDN